MSDFWNDLLADISQKSETKDATTVEDTTNVTSPSHESTKRTKGVSSPRSTKAEPSQSQALETTKQSTTNSISYTSSTPGIHRRDLLAAKRGFAVEFPLLCAKLGASVIPEVLVLDEDMKGYVPLPPLIDESVPIDMDTFLPSNVEIIVPQTIPSSRDTSTWDTGPDIMTERNVRLLPTKKDECPSPYPVVLVKFDNNKKQENLRRFEMKGFQVELAIIDALGMCFLWYSTLDELHLERCGLDSNALEILAKHMRNAKTVRELIIIGNPIAGQNYQVVIADYTGLEHLTLQMCEIDDTGAKQLAEKLIYSDPPDDQTLISLDLSTNYIGDEGAKALANAMRTNRTLKKLRLGKNLVGDVGLAAIAAVLQKFPLRSDEIKYRNNRSFQRNNMRMQRIHEMQAAEDDEYGSAQRKRNSRGRKPSKKIKDQVWRELKYDKHPYMWDARPIGTDLWCIGNVTLESLDISDNKIGVKGVQKIIDSIKYQNMLKRTEKRAENGLTNVEILGNSLLPDIPEVRRLEEILTTQQRENKIPKHCSPSVKTRKVNKSKSPKSGVANIRDESTTYMGLFKDSEIDSKATNSTPRPNASKYEPDADKRKTTRKGTVPSRSTMRKRPSKKIELN